MITSLLETERARRPGASDAACVGAIADRIIEELEVAEPPVDLDMLTSYLGVRKIQPDRRLLEAGCLTCDGDRLEIRIRATDAPSRQRFTVCHECGHTFFPGFARSTQYRCSPREGGPRLTSQSPQRRNSVTDPHGVEQLCDLAASRLLLPTSLFEPDVRASVFAISSIVELADEYEASLEATARRYVAVRKAATALLILRPVQKPTQYGSDAQAQLRVTATATTGAWPFIPRFKSVQPDGPFARALDGELVHEMALLTDVFKAPQPVEVSAQLFPYRSAGQLEMRVLALLRRPGA